MLMKTAISVVLAVAFCASAFAGSDQPGQNQKVQTQKVSVTKPQKKYKACYIMSSASGIPMPCERIRGIPTTPGAMDIIGNHSPN
jgi:hypothetical protein